MRSMPSFFVTRHTRSNQRLDSGGGSGYRGHALACLPAGSAPLELRLPLELPAAMKFQELTILLPCHSFEDFPMHHEGDEAEGLLAAWTAMWHPALLAESGRLPSWCRADSPPEEVQNKLLIIPQVSESLLLAGWPARAKNEGACIVRKLKTRPEIVALALAESQPNLDRLPAEMIDDFFALGFAYLQVELLTRQMRYMSNLDEVHFQAETLRAAEAAMQGDAEAARKHLVSCFEVLTEARERFYPAEAYLLDITLLAPTTLGEPLGKELRSPTPINILASGETIERLAEIDAGLLEAVASAVRDEKAGLIGGELSERELPLLPVESVLSELRRGGDVYARHFGQRPKIYGRRRFGLTPILPQILARSGFLGALHATLEDGQFPRGEQSKIRWEGLDASAIDALTRLPLDAARAESFLSYPTKMGESMDLDHVAIVVFAHWPGQASLWYDDLRRICSYSPVMGRFVTIREFFEQTDLAGRLSKFAADKYRAPYLKQAVIRRQPDPLSRIAGHHRRQLLAESEHTLSTIVSLLSGKAADNAELLTAVEDFNRNTETSSTSAEPLERRLEDQLRETAETFAQSLPRGTERPTAGLLVCNPHSFSRRVCVELPEAMPLPAVEGAVRAAQESNGKKHVVVDVPALGFARLGPGGEPASPTPAPAGGSWWFGKSSRAAEKVLAEGHTLRNEHMEVTIDAQTGGIRSVHDYRTRGNRLSQQLAFRLPGARPKPGDVWRDPDLEAAYSSMVAESVELVSAGTALGEIVSQGRLLDAEGRRLAGFRQTYRLCRGSPVLMVEVELEIDEEPRADPWNSYYAARFAWADEAADLFRNVGWSVQPTEAKRLEATLLVEARTENTRTAILTGGLPYHRRIGFRMLDSLLVVRGESQRRFRFGVGFDLPYALPSALELISPVTAVAETASPPRTANTGWLFHVDAKNVVATHWEPLVVDGQLRGFRARLLETEGRPGRARLRAFRAIASARQTDFLDQTLVDLPLDEDGVRLDFAAHEWVQVEARWRE